MTYLITLFVREGIVMAADSRITLNNTIVQSDSTNKLFLAEKNRIGISTCGQADIDGVPMAGYVESFINEKLSDRTKVDEVPAMLLDYFYSMKAPPKTLFYVAGYKEENGKLVPYVYFIDVATREIKRWNEPDANGVPQLGACWGGESDTMIRLMHTVYQDDGQGNFTPMQNFSIFWQFFTLQDAIDFAEFAVKTTIDMMRFQPRTKTVGGPVDILVIKPKEAMWVRKKTLKV